MVDDNVDMFTKKIPLCVVYYNVLNLRMIIKGLFDFIYNRTHIKKYHQVERVIGSLYDLNCGFK